jgi:hypothetical protein
MTASHRKESKFDHVNRKNRSHVRLQSEALEPSAVAIRQKYEVDTHTIKRERTEATRAAFRRKMCTTIRIYVVQQDAAI